MSPSKVLEGFVDDGKAAPLAGVPAIATVVGTGVVVGSTATDADGHWYFDDLPEGQEYFVNVVDIEGNAVVRGPWSGEVRDVWVRDRLSLSPTGVADLIGLNTVVDGVPLVLDPNPANTLTWGPTGLYAAGAVGLTEAAADLRYVNVTGDTMTGVLTVDGDLSAANNALVATPAAVFITTDLFVNLYPVALDPLAGNALQWSSSGFYVPPVPAAIDAWTKTESDARYPLKTDPDPYPTYLTSTEADALFLTPAEGNAAYATSAHNHDATYVLLTGGSVLTGLLGPSTHNTRDLGTTGTRWRALYGMTGDLSTSLTVATKPVAISPDAANIVEWRANGFYAAAGAVSDIWVNTTGDTMTGDLNMTANVLPTVTNTRDLGTTALRWRKLWAVDAELTTGLIVASKSVAISATAGNTLSWNSDGFYSNALNQATADTAYVNAGGDTMVGDLNMTANVLPTVTNVRSLGSTSLRWLKVWATDADFTNAPTVGGSALLTATAADALFLTPAEGNAAYATSAHAHDAAYVNVGGDTMTGQLLLASGALSAPAYGFSAETNSGFYLTAVTGGPTIVNAGTARIAATNAGANIFGTLGVSGLLTASAGLGVTGAATISTTLDVTGAQTNGGNLTQQANTTIGHTLYRASTDNVSASINTRKSRGTIGSATIVASGDQLGIWQADGWDGGAWRAAAAIEMKVDAAPGSSDMPGLITFYTTTDGSASLSGRLTIDSAGLATFYNNVRLNGNVGFYNTAPQAKPTITGSRGANAALADLLTKLATLGLLVNSTS